MSLIKGKQVAEVVALLATRDVRLVHACQLKDFCSYLQLGGVPSRMKLEESKTAFTAFDTDYLDQANGVWERVFFNLSDFGDWFSRGKNTLPNPYGPIALVLKPQVLLGATDISLTLRSAGAKAFDRAAEAISLDDVPRIFVDGTGPKRHVKFTKELEAAFPGRSVSTPELNCTYPNQLGPIDQLRFVLVDNYPGLADKVRDVVGKHGLKSKIMERFTTEPRKVTYRVLWGKIAEGIEDVSVLSKEPDIDASTKSWCDGIGVWDKGSFQFGRYARYLKSGTIDEMA